jgi:hypothetical protein
VINAQACSVALSTLPVGWELLSLLLKKFLSIVLLLVFMGCVCSFPGLAPVIRVTTEVQIQYYSFVK